jgi:hypothetical protein
MPRAQGVVQYRIDASDCLTWTNAGWDAFAMANGCNRAVLNSSLWEYISDRSTAYIYREIIRYVRDTGNALSVPFRCDSPADCRRMTLKIEALPAGTIQFTASTNETRSHGPVRLIDVSVPRASEVLLICSWCKRVLVDRWMELELAAQHSSLLEATSLPALSHGICETCSKEVQRSLGGG